MECTDGGDIDRDEGDRDKDEGETDKGDRDEGFPRRRVRGREREFSIDNLLVRIHCIIVMIRWTGLAPIEFEFPFPGSLTSTFLESERVFY